MAPSKRRLAKARVQSEKEDCMTTEAETLAYVADMCRQLAKLTRGVRPPVAAALLLAASLADDGQPARPKQKVA
jgi:hypothetical protein